MIRNYFKIAWRSLLRYRLTTGVSLFGLFLGVTCFLLLSTCILNEIRYDRFHDKADRIVAVNMSYKSPSDAQFVHTASTPTAMAPVAKREFSEVEDATRYYKYGSREILVNDEKFTENDMAIADEAFFRIFSFSFIEGAPGNALKDPKTVVITKSTAERFFGKEPAFGKTIQINKDSWKISGVIEDIPSYSSLQFNILGSYSSDKRANTESWSSANDRSFLLLNTASSPNDVQKKVNSYISNRFSEEINAGFKLQFNLQPLTQVHLNPVDEAENRVAYLYILGGIAVLLLVIACINFTNLMTAKSSERLREIGVRKVLGAKRVNLIFQFLTESAIVTFIAITLGVIAAYLLLPSFNTLTGLNINVKTWNGEYFLLFLVLLFIGLTLSAGTWPALILSNFKPVTALKKKHLKIGSSALLGKSLLIFQFTVTIAFIITTLVAQKQLHFIQNTNTGVDRSNVLVINGGGIPPQQFETFKQELSSYNSIENVTASYDSPVNIQGGYSLTVAGRIDNEGMSITAIPVDKDFVSTMNLKIITGKDFTAADKKLVSTTPQERQYAFMLNKKAVEALGLTPDEAIGRAAALNGRTGFIKAILEDFNFVSLHQQISPVVIFTEYDWFGEILIKTSGNDLSRALADISTTWNAFNPHKPLEYHFLDDEYAELYQTEHRTTSILNLFSFITILISCLGLFGLAAFTATQRKKEIGIRKVLGASVSHITTSLSVDFLKLVLLGMLIAFPIAWYATNYWLQGFAYKINMPYELFVIGGLLAIATALATVSFQVIKAAVANPVKSLRTE